MHKREYSDARESFIQAEEYSTHNRAKSSAIANIGLTYKKQRNYEEALKYYMDAVNYPDPLNVLTTASIYNNIAEVFKSQKDYSNALEYIEKALEISEKENDLGKHLIYIATKVDIQKRIGNKKSYKTYFSVLLSTKNRQIQSKPYVLDDIEAFIEDTSEIPCLDELSDIIIELRNATSSEDYKKGLTECVGFIFIKIKELTGRVYNE
jgi:tetratricopeptide (TPR) repeat protein